MAWGKSTKQRRAMRFRRAVVDDMYRWTEIDCWALSRLSMLAHRLTASRLRGQGWKHSGVCDVMVRRCA